MKYCAIIAEFNPFTNGHQYIIQEAKRKTGLDVICLMSGNIVQRGELSILDKYTRASHALKAGASFVLELPTAYATSSADDFGSGAIKCIYDLNACSHLAFGVETDNTEFLETLAKFKTNEPKAFKNILKSYIKKGHNYSVASYKAYLEQFPDNAKDVKEIFDSPNNILALTYLTAIYKINADITPVYIKRLDKGYNSNLTSEAIINGVATKFASASHIRAEITSGNYDKVKELVPSYVFEDLKNLNSETLKNKQLIFDAMILSHLRKPSVNELYSYHDYREGVASLIYNNTFKNGTLDEVINLSTNKSNRASRIRKLVLYPYLNLTGELMLKTKNNKSILNVLAVNQTKKIILVKIKKDTKCKLIISSSDYNNLTQEEKEILDPNQLGSDIYSLCCGVPKAKDLTKFI